MLTLPSSVRIYMSAEPVDLRRGFDGLAAATRQIIQEDPLLCVERQYAADSHKHSAKLLTACRFACGRRHIRSTDPRADSAPNP